MEATFENIQSLIVSMEENGQMITIKFQAENQEMPLETVAVIMPDQDEIMKNAMAQVGKVAAMNAGINMASNALGNAVGGITGEAAKMAGSTVGAQMTGNAMNTDKLMQTEVTDEKKQAAILQAFVPFQVYYQWEDGKWKYVQPGA